MPPARLPLAQGRVVFYGQPVAVVVAQSEAIAAEAASLVQVDYEELPVVMDTEAAMRRAGVAIGALVSREGFA